MIHRISVLSVLAPLVLSQTAPAPLITDNQYGSAYAVALTQGPGPLAGTFDFKASVRGISVAFNMNGFNISDDTTYTYHIHEKPVPKNGNCNATGEHFDPYRVGTARKCDPTKPELCQLGDLSGKHGVIAVNASAPTFTAAYTDDFLSTTPGDMAFFANLSIVVHRKKDSYRLNCGNFEMYGYPVIMNGTTQTAGNLSTTMRLDPTTSVSFTDGGVIFSVGPNATTTAGGANTATASQHTQYSPSASKTSSGMSLQTGNHGSGRVEASMLMLGLTAVIPAMFL